ncbi:hypothetical protein CBR_g37380 [Chara braunii]|uniref:Uncharacterized protein n=1 Tax=Chara braunii TaxID=69332 RepID=A0A388JZR4_CHABU|nr:hypothetical protein CBR_g37380 [Chara braunii]|eukprot:GBG63294.1 hypothetical protein CBR_g37380 [Chara braunii]
MEEGQGQDDRNEQYEEEMTKIYTEEEKEQINSLLELCFRDGIMPAGLDVGVAEVTDEIARFDLNEEFSNQNVEWLIKHAVTVQFLNDAAVLSNSLKKKLVRIYENAWYDSGLLDEGITRGRYQSEGKNLCSFVSSQTSVIEWMLHKESDVIVLEGKEYRVAFLPWMTFLEMREFKDTTPKIFWVRCPRVPLQLMSTLQNAIEKTFGAAVKNYPTEQDDEEPELGSVRFDLKIQAKERVRPRLVVGIPNQGDYYFKVLSASTPWCEQCKTFYHKETDECCPVKAEAEFDPFAPEGEKPTPPKPPFSGFVPLGETPPVAGFRRFPRRGEKKNRWRNQSGREERGNQGQRFKDNNSEGSTSGNRKGNGGGGHRLRRIKEKSKTTTSRDLRKGKSYEEEGTEEEDGMEGTSLMEEQAAGVLAKGRIQGQKRGEVSSSQGKRWIPVGQGDRAYNDLHRDQGGGMMGMAGVIPTLGQEDANIPKIFVPIILANSTHGILVMANLLANGAMELPTAYAEEALTESVIMSKVKKLVPACLSLRLISTLRVGVDTTQDCLGNRVRMYYVFLDDRMTNTIKKHLETLDKGWFPLSILSSPLNDGLDSILFKGYFSARTIAKWLFHSAHRKVLFSESFVDTLLLPWEEGTGGSEGIRRRKKGETDIEDESRIHDTHGPGVANAS